MTSTKIEDYNPTELTFSVLYEEVESIHHPEDGYQLFAEVYYVQAEAPNGVRWRRYIGIADWDVITDEDTGDLVVVRTADRGDLGRKCGELVYRLETSQTRRLNPDRWEYAGACYGSEAYENLNLEAETAAWEREAEYWG